MNESFENKDEEERYFNENNTDFEYKNETEIDFNNEQYEKVNKTLIEGSNDKLNNSFLPSIIKNVKERSKSQMIAQSRSTSIMIPSITQKSGLTSNDFSLNSKYANLNYQQKIISNESKLPQLHKSMYSNNTAEQNSQTKSKTLQKPRNKTVEPREKANKRLSDHINKLSKSFVDLSIIEKQNSQQKKLVDTKRNNQVTTASSSKLKLRNIFSQRKLVESNSRSIQYTDSFDEENIDYDNDNYNDNDNSNDNDNDETQIRNDLSNQNYNLSISQLTPDTKLTNDINISGPTIDYETNNVQPLISDYSFSHSKINVANITQKGSNHPENSKDSLIKIEKQEVSKFKKDSKHYNIKSKIDNDVTAPLLSIMKKPKVPVFSKKVTILSRNESRVHNESKRSMVDIQNSEPKKNSRNDIASTSNKKEEKNMLNPQTIRIHNNKEIKSTSPQMQRYYMPHPSKYYLSKS